MGKFIDLDKVAVRDSAGNVIFVRRKMDFGAVSRVRSAAPEDRVITMFKVNIVGWEGPDFSTVPCTPDNIERLDPDDPFIELLATKIGELNPQAQSPNLPSPSTPGSTNGGEGDLQARAADDDFPTS